MAEDKKEFPWIQLIATVGTIMAALIGITPYILKLNTPATPTIVIVTLPPAVTTPAATTPPVTTVETTPAVTTTTVVTTVPTTGPPPATETPTGTETPLPTTETPLPTTAPTTVPTTAPLPSIQIAVNATSVIQGGLILASGSTDAAVSQVTITLKNSTTFQSEAVPVALTGGTFQFLVDTSSYAPGDYTIYAAVPETPAVSSASFVITAA